MPQHIPPTDVVGLGLNPMDTICVVPQFPQPIAEVRQFLRQQDERNRLR